MPKVLHQHMHLFICDRNELHVLRLVCHERLAICPECGAAGRMIVVEAQNEETS